MVEFNGDLFPVHSAGYEVLADRENLIRVNIYVDDGESEGHEHLKMTRQMDAQELSELFEMGFKEAIPFPLKIELAVGFYSEPERKTFECTKVIPRGGALILSGTIKE